MVNVVFLSEHFVSCWLLIGLPTLIRFVEIWRGFKILF